MTDLALSGWGGKLRPEGLRTDLERSRKADERLRRRVSFAALKETHIVAMKAGPARQLFLTEARTFTTAANAAAECEKIRVRLHLTDGCRDRGDALHTDSVSSDIGTIVAIALIGACLVAGFVFFLMETVDRPRQRQRERGARADVLFSTMDLVITEHVEALARRLEQLRYKDAYGQWVTKAWDKELAYFFDSLVADRLGEISPEERVWLLDLLHGAAITLALDFPDEVQRDSSSRNGVDYEREVGAALVGAGFGVRFTPPSGDQGVDLIAERGGQSIAIQCKNYGGPAGNDAVQQVYAGAKFYGAQRAVVVAPSGFTVAARQLASSLGVDCLHHSEIVTILAPT